MPSLNSLLEYCQDNNRICPLPTKWDELWNLLPYRRRVVGGWEPALPLILSAWWHTSNLEKALRLAEHVRWAARHGSLSEIDPFLRALPEAEWHHLDD